jgi:hypothetical protein
LRCALQFPSRESENGSIVNFGKNIVPSAENVLKPSRGRRKDETAAMGRVELAGSREKWAIGQKQGKRATKRRKSNASKKNT